MDFQVFREKATFDEAEKRCISVGGHLASIHSEQENKFVTELSTDGRRREKLEFKSYTWIGLRQNHYPLSREWTWTDG
ncbi:hypothetical protein COOONC_22994, partial [Cooperia oncophora]